MPEQPSPRRQGKELVNQVRPFRTTDLYFLGSEESEGTRTWVLPAGAPSQWGRKHSGGGSGGEGGPLHCDINANRAGSASFRKPGRHPLSGTGQGHELEEGSEISLQDLGAGGSGDGN